MHAGAPGDTESRSDQGVSAPGGQPGDIREHPDTPQPVSREVSADAYDGPLSALRGHVDDLGAWLAIWSARDDGKPDAHARRCASDAVDAIDAALRELHEVRQRLIGEISLPLVVAQVWHAGGRRARVQLLPCLPYLSGDITLTGVSGEGYTTLAPSPL